jgi:hypothetical protein
MNLLSNRKADRLKCRNSKNHLALHLLQKIMNRTYKQYLSLALIGLATMATSLYAQTSCTGSISVSPARTIFGLPITANISIRNATGAGFLRIILPSGLSLTTTSIPVNAPLGNADLALTIPNSTSSPIIPALPTNNEQQQTLTVQVFGASPDPLPCTITPATLSIRKLPTATSITRDNANPPTFTAQVYSTQSIPANGTITFRNGANVLATRPLSATEPDLNTRTATFTPGSAIPVGTLAVVAEFDGDQNFLKSRSEESVFTNGPDTSPDDFSFPDASNAPLGTPITSSSATITGINTAATIMVTGGSYSINNAPFTAASGTISVGQTLRLQHVASCTPGTAVTTSVTVGDVTRTFISRAATSGGVGTGDTDGDGVPDSLECVNGTNINAKDNNLFGPDAASLVRFVQQMYRDFLGREADADGLNFWTGRISRGEATRFDLLSFFIFSAEYQNAVKPLAIAFLDANMLTRANETAATFVYAAYRSLLGRNPDAGGYTFWYNAIASGAQPQTAVLNEFYYAGEYLNRFLVPAAQPAKCVGTVGYTASTSVATSAVSNVLNVGLTRSSGEGNCTVEAVLCTTSTCGTTATAANYNTSGFSGEPVRRLITFAAGQTTANVPIAIVNPNAASAVTLRLSLQNVAWGGLSIAGNTTHTTTFPTLASGCEWGAGIDGNCLPGPKTRAEAPSNNITQGCFSQGPGPCQAFQIARATCTSDVTSLWQYAMTMPAVVADAQGNIIADYGQQKVFALTPGQALAFRVKLPRGTIGGIAATNASVGSEAARFISISETPCDFNAQKAVANDVCYTSSAGDIGANIQYIVSDTPVAGRCTLKPDTPYYINYRHELARDTTNNGSPRDDCSARGHGVCGSAVVFGGLRQ